MCADAIYIHHRTLQTWRTQFPPEGTLTPCTAPHWIVRGPRAVGKRFFCRQLIHELHAGQGNAPSAHLPLTHKILVPISRDMQVTVLMSAHHVEIDMGLLALDRGRSSLQPDPVTLWVHLLRHAQDAFLARGSRAMTVLCTHFERASDTLVDMFHHFLTPFRHGDASSGAGEMAASTRASSSSSPASSFADGHPLRVHFVLHTESTCFFPDDLLCGAAVIALGRPNRHQLTKSIGSAATHGAVHATEASRAPEDVGEGNDHGGGGGGDTGASLINPPQSLRSLSDATLDRATPTPTHVALAARIVREMAAAALPPSGAAAVAQLRQWAQQMQVQSAPLDVVIWMLLAHWTAHPAVAHTSVGSPDMLICFTAWLQCQRRHTRAEFPGVHVEHLLSTLWLHMTTAVHDAATADAVSPTGRHVGASVDAGSSGGGGGGGRRRVVGHGAGRKRKPALEELPPAPRDFPS